MQLGEDMAFASAWEYGVCFRKGTSLFLLVDIMPLSFVWRYGVCFRTDLSEM